MLKPKYIEQLPAAMVELYSEVEQDILADMARRIAAYDYWIPAAEHQRKALIELGNFHSYVIKALSARTGKTTAELERLMEEAGLKALSFDVAVYREHGLDPPPLAASKELQKVLRAGLRQTSGLFVNLSRTTANTASKQFEDALDRAWLQISSGAFDSNTAIRMAVKDLSQKGVKSIQYPSGHSDTLEVAVRRATVTGVNQTALRLQDALADEMGCDLVETTAHAGARPEHAVWQGQIFSRSGKSDRYPDFVSSTGYGSGAGLGGWNCRHSFHPYFEGDPKAYSKKMLEGFEAKDYEYNGQKMTEYEATQQQRYVERQVRRWKRENAAMAAAGLDTSESASRIRQWQETQKDFLRQTGLKRQGDREQVIGFGWKQAAVARQQDHIIEQIGRSVGAKAKNYDVYNPATGSFVHLAEGTRITQPKNHVMAGKGRDREIDCIDWLVDKYGGIAVEWSKEKGFGYVEDEYGELRRVELHWYQEQSVGKVEMKIKMRNGRLYLDEE